MTIALLVSLAVIAGRPAVNPPEPLVPVAVAAAQTQTQTPPARSPAPAPAPRAPQRPAQTPRRQPTSPAVLARTGVVITVKDANGMTVGGVRVLLSGPGERSGTTDPNGVLRVNDMEPGTYKLHFSGDSFNELDREVAVRANQMLPVDVTLMPAAPAPAPAPAAPAAPPPAAAPTVGPAGMPQAVSLLAFLDKNTIRNNEPRRETLVSCSGNTRVMLVQTNQDQPSRVYEGAEVTYYVVRGDGTLRANGQEGAIADGSFVSIPRGTAHELLHRGRRPLIVVMQVSGEPCEEAK